MKKASLLLILASGALLASCGNHVLTPEEISSWEAEHPASVAVSSETPVESSEDPSIEPSIEPSSEPSEEPSVDTSDDTSIDITEDTSDDTIEDTSETTSEDTSEVTSEDTSTGYAAYLNGTALTLVDATTEIDSGDTATEQWKAVDIDVAEGDTLTFTLDGEAIFPGAGYESAGNNAHYDEETKAITVRSSAEDATLYFKVYSDGYDVWLTGYNAPDPVLGEDVTATFTINYGTEYGQNVYIVGDFCNWGLEGAVALTWGEGNNWSGTMTKPEGTVIKYKFVIEAGGAIVRWEADPNREYTFDSANLAITASWQA